MDGSAGECPNSNRTFSNRTFSSINPFENRDCVFNTCCGVCRHKTFPEQSVESLCGNIEFSGFPRYLASPIDEHDTDSSAILERKYKDMYAARTKFYKPFSSDEHFDLDLEYNRSIYLHQESLELIVWIDFPKPTVEKLMNTKTFVELKEYIHHIFNLNDLNDVLKAHIVTDLYSYGVQFGRINEFNLQQMSTFLGIMKRVHEKNIGTPFTNVNQCFDYCKELTLLHSVHRPPFWADIFTKDIAEVIIHYMVTTYFKHFRLYKNAFTNYVVLDVNVIYPNEVEEVPLVEDESASSINSEETFDTEERAVEASTTTESPKIILL